LTIAVDEVRRPQKMWIMNIVWPVTALYFSVFGLWAYHRFGRAAQKTSSVYTTKDQARPHKEERQPRAKRDPTWRQTAISDSHCAAGCTIADILTEFSVFGLGLTVFGSELYASFLWDFVTAWALGIVFQYFTIKPMRDLTFLGGIRAAVKADTLSILAFQVGMYGWMSLVYFKLFPNPHLHPNQAGYWLMMQLAMICGFATAFPVNRQLIKMGWKEAM
jgi:hypothetical protein